MLDWLLFMLKAALVYGVFPLIGTALMIPLAKHLSIPEQPRSVSSDPKYLIN